MAAQNHGWTIGEVGASEGPAAGDRHKPDGQLDVSMSLEARQDVPYEVDFHKLADISGAPGRVDVPDPSLAGGIPDPGCGDPGTTLDLGAVAPEKDGQMYDLDGSGAPAASGSPLSPPIA